MVDVEIDDKTMSCVIVVYIPAVTFVESGVSKLWLLLLKPVFLYCALTFVKFAVLVLNVV